MATETTAWADGRRQVAEVVTLFGREKAGETATRLLIANGVRVHGALTPVDALRVLLQAEVHVLLADIDLPALDIWAFLREARATAPWVGILAIARNPTAEDHRQAAAAGIPLLLASPLNEPDLLRLTKELRERPAAGGLLQDANLVHRMAHALRSLGTLGNRAVNTATLSGALRELGCELARAVPCDMLGVLAVDETERILQVVDSRGMGHERVQRMREALLRQYAVLGNEPLPPDSIRINLDAPEQEAPPEGDGEIVCMPVISSGRVEGGLALVFGEPHRTNGSDRLLACHIANQLSCLFSVLRGMRRLATRDPLTNLLNRVGLEDALERHWLVSRRYNFSMAVVVVDLDYFKTLNDSYGHSTGDQVLYEFSRVFEKVARVSDIVARYGGDEFVAILPQADEEQARIFGERLVDYTRKHTFSEQTHQLGMTVSVGISTSMNPTAPATSAALLSQADRALYMAKRAGRNRLCLWPGQASRPAPRTSAADGGRYELAPVKLAERIMVVDDEPAVRRVMAMILEREGYSVSTFGSAANAVEGLRAAGGEPFDILLTDISMPGKSGIELLKEIDDQDESIVKIVMTGYATVDNAVSSLREGAYDFIQKPVDRTQVLAVVHRALEYRRLRIENANYQVRLEELVRERSAQLAESLEEVKRSHEFTLEAMVAMLDARERQTGQHSLRVRELTTILGRHMGFKGADLETLARGALLHDIGKISVPDSILLKPGPLTDEEWRVMRTHPEVGYGILVNSPYLKDVAEIVLQHHEAYNGAGYPNKLKGSEITLGARIFAVIDAYEAMRSARVYHSTRSAGDALAEISRNRGVQFDPDVVDVFLQCHPEVEEFWDSHRL